MPQKVTHSGPGLLGIGTGVFMGLASCLPPWALETLQARPVLTSAVSVSPHSP